MRLKDKIAIVVGAGQSPGEGTGNGRATAQVFAREGATVACIDLQQERAEETAEIIRSEGGKALGRGAAVQPAGAGEVEKCLVDLDRLDQGRQLVHQGPDRFRRGGIFGHVGRHHDGLRAGAAGLEHGHGRMNAGCAGDIAGGGNDAARSAAADNHRLVAQLRAIALFDAGVEGVAIDMGDGKKLQLVMGDEARAGA